MAYEWFVDLTLLELQTALTSARAAYNRVLLGESVRVAVDRSGERVEFSAVNLGHLMAYIAQLSAEIARRGLTTPSIAGRPLSFTF